MGRNPPKPFFRGFTFIELVVVASILSLALALAFVHFRNTRASVTAVASHLNSHMELRKATDKLISALLDGCEVIKPLPGSTLTCLVVKDIANFTKMFYLETVENPDPKAVVKKTYSLFSYLDTYTGKFEPDNRKLLFDQIKDLTFTTVSPGLVVVHLIVVDPSGKELGSVFEVPLKNLGSVDE